MIPASHHTFIDTPNCVLEDRVQYSTVHIPNVFFDDHLQIINCVGIVRINWVFHRLVHRDFLNILYNGLIKSYLTKRWYYLIFWTFFIIKHFQWEANLPHCNNDYFFDVMPVSLVASYQSFRRTCCFYLQASTLTVGPEWCHITENSTLHHHYQNLIFQYPVVLIPKLLILHTAVVDTVWLQFGSPRSSHTVLYMSRKHLLSWAYRVEMWCWVPLSHF